MKLKVERIGKQREQITFNHALLIPYSFMLGNKWLKRNLRLAKGINLVPIQLKRKTFFSGLSVLSEF